MVSPPSGPARTAVRAIRGATTVEADDADLVKAATQELLARLLEANAVEDADLISAVFTVTHDLTSTFPARAACEMGWTDVPLLCALEIPVEGALGRCIRVLLHVASDRPRAAITHVYLRRAVTLRPDLVAAAEARPASDAAGTPPDPSAEAARAR